MTAPIATGPGVRSVWATPLILGTLMGAGLIVALVGDGVLDALACLLLIGVMGYAAVSAIVVAP